MDYRGFRSALAAENRGPSVLGTIGMGLAGGLHGLAQQLIARRRQNEIDKRWGAEFAQRQAQLDAQNQRADALLALAREKQNALYGHDVYPQVPQTQLPEPPISAPPAPPSAPNYFQQEPLSTPMAPEPSTPKPMTPQIVHIPGAYQKAQAEKAAAQKETRAYRSSMLQNSLVRTQLALDKENDPLRKAHLLKQIQLLNAQIAKAGEEPLSVQPGTDPNTKQPVIFGVGLRSGKVYKIDTKGITPSAKPKAPKDNEADAFTQFMTGTAPGAEPSTPAPASAGGGKNYVYDPKTGTLVAQ